MRISDWSSDVCSSDLLHAVRRYQWQSGQLRRRIAQRARVTHHHGVSFAALDSLVDRLAADDRGDEPLHVGLGEAVTRRSLRFDLDIQVAPRSEEHTSELQSLMRSPYAVFCLKKKNNISITPQSVR